MNSNRFYAIGVMVLLYLTPSVLADSFGTGANQFEIDFVTISGDATIANGTYIGGNVTFRDPGDYRMGVYEVTNDQWNRFQASLGVAVTGAPSNAYDQATYFSDADVPTNNVSWYEAAQFVNWLNTSTGHQAAYNFTGTQGTGDYTFAVWSPEEADNGTNLFRHKDAVYFLPTEDEWVKAAYWNGTGLQSYATKPGEGLVQGDGVSGIGWNYWDDGYSFYPTGPWAVGSGSEELNGTFDMMGNVNEWMESPSSAEYYVPDTKRGLRGGCYEYGGVDSGSSGRYSPNGEGSPWGFRVASEALAEGLAGDFDGDGAVTALDLNTLFGALGGADMAFDLTGDGVVDQADVDEWVFNLVPIGDNYGTIYGDFNLDGAVDAGDLALLGSKFGTVNNLGWSVGDGNGDGWVDAGDLALLGANFGTIVHPVPEPATMGVLALGGVAFLKRRRG